VIRATIEVGVQMSLRHSDFASFVLLDIYPLLRLLDHITIIVSFFEEPPFSIVEMMFPPMVPFFQHPLQDLISFVFMVITILELSEISLGF
jgi:hypothetical protein